MCVTAFLTEYQQIKLKNMTREEEIMKAARVYANGIAQHLPNKKYCEEDFSTGAEWADAHPHWISVEEEPKINPNDSEWEYSDDVIVALKDGSIAVGRYERDNSTGEHYWVLYGVDKDLVVTHWMRLPQAPTEGIKGNQGKTSPNLSNSSNAGKDLKGGEK